MRPTRFESTGRPLDERDLDEVERAIGLKLPLDLRRHYLTQNGGRPTPNCFPHADEIFEIQIFLPMLIGDRNIGFEEAYKDLVESNDAFPRGFIPFAVDDTGDYFIYNINANHVGEICFNQSDYFGDEKRFVVKLSDSLAKFVDSLVKL